VGLVYFYLDFDYLDLDQDITVFRLQRVNRELGIRVVRGLASLEIPCPAMPGADNLAALDHALAEGTAAVQAYIVYGAVGSVHVGDAYGLAPAGEFFGCAGGGEFGLAGQLDEVRHLMRR